MGDKQFYFLPVVLDHEIPDRFHHWYARSIVIVTYKIINNKRSTFLPRFLLLYILVFEKSCLTPDVGAFLSPRSTLATPQSIATAYSLPIIG